MKLKDNPIVYLGLKLWHNSQNKKKVSLYLAMSWISNLIHSCIPLIFALILDELQKNGVTDKNINYLILLSFLFVVRSAITWSLHGPSRMLENDNAFMCRANYKIRFLNGVLGLPLSWHNEHHSGDTNDKLEKGTAGLFSYAENTFRILHIVNSMILSFCILMFFDVFAGFIALAMICITISIIVIFDKKLVLQYKHLNGMENKIAEKILDIIANVNTVVILRIEKLLLKSMATKTMEPRDLFWDINVRQETKWFLVSMCVNIMLFLVIGCYLYRVYYGNITLAFGTFFALYGYTNNVADTFFDFASFYGELLRYKSRVLNAEELASQFKPTKNDCNGNGSYNWKELKADSINFSYHTDGGADLHLENVSIVARRGEKIALIGSTGSGKTTLLKVIRELYQPQNAIVYIDGKKMPDGFSSISSQISLIPQEPEIFATTILENITMGMEYDRALVQKYTDMACFTEVAEQLPKKFESLITEKGVNLSGGEKQRLALARGLLASENKSIVLLDEPTSSIDVATELTIYRNIFQAFCEKSVISSIHRLHLLPMFDYIYFFSDGKIIASGNLAELLKNSAEFKELWLKYQSMSQDLQDRV